MSWPPPKPPVAYKSRRRAVRRALVLSKPTAREASLDVIPPVLAVLAGYGLRALLPASIRDVAALLLGAAVYIAARVIANLWKPTAPIGRDFELRAYIDIRHAATKAELRLSGTTNLVDVCDIACLVTDPDGHETFAAGLHDMASGLPSRRYVYPDDFHGVEAVNGLHRAVWMIREDPDDDQWINVGATPFTLRGIVSGDA